MVTLLIINSQVRHILQWPIFTVVDSMYPSALQLETSQFRRSFLSCTPLLRAEALQ
jgi:hypothetical protein